MKKIIIDDAVAYAEPIFSTLGEVVSLPGKEINAQSVKNADALIVRSRTQVNKPLLHGSSIEFVGSTVVGLDHIDQDYLDESGINFYSAQGCNANSVSEYVLTVLFDLAELHNFHLSEKSIGIIGVGHVGKLVEQKARALNMTVRLNDPPRAEKEGTDKFVCIEEALSSDIVTFHTPLTFEGNHKTFHLLNQNNFHHIKPDTIVINAARGGIIDENIWAKTVTRANIIDCWENEPFINHELYKHATLATPHIAGHALDAKIKGSTMVYDALCKLWEIPKNEDWKACLPPQPKTIQPVVSLNSQSMIDSILRECYQPKEDDLAIRSTDINEVHKKFEYYRRHYPEHREWFVHEVMSSGSNNIDKCLSSLGFKIIYA